MSNSGSKLSPKQLIIEHGEKFILGLAGLFVLIGIGTTQWSTYDKKPENFSQKIDAGKATFDASIWPEPEKETFVALDPGDEVAKILEGIPPSLTYEYSVKWAHRITKAREKVAEPEYDPIIDLVADAGRLLLELSPEPEETPGTSLIGVEVAAVGGAVDGPPTGSSAAPEGPRIDGPRIDGPRGGANSPAGPQSLQDDDGDEFADENAYGPGDMGDDYAGGSGQLGARRNVEPRGYRFAAVRGIFRMKQQIEKVRRALRLDTAQEAYLKVRFWDFELQRQTAVAGSNPWPNEWEAVDIDVAVKLLERIEFDVDVVDEQYRDAVFTIPLPYRVTGSWATSAGPNGILASHPQIKRLLNDKEQQEQETRAKAMLRAADREQKIKEATGGGGFKGVQVDTRSMRGNMMSDPSSMSAYNESYNELKMEEDSEYEGSGSSAGSGYSGMGQGRMDVVATPDLLLFRFLDFSVVPGNAYRYRVRLKLLNPNFDRDPGELQDFASREGKFRFTPWSEISTPAMIQDENEVYVAEVSDRKGVSMDAYQWMSETGSYVHGPFKKLQRADRLASWTREVTGRGRNARTETYGGVTTEVLRPSESTFIKEQIDFVTPNTLVDFNYDRLLNPEDHPDLGLDTKTLSTSLEEVVIVNRFGDLVRLDTFGNAISHERARNRMTQQDSLWAHLKQKVMQQGEGGGDIGDLFGPGSGDENSADYGNEDSSQYPGMGDSGGSGGSSNPRRRRSSLKRNSQMQGSGNGSSSSSSGKGF
jgi:hypothetical protein